VGLTEETYEYIQIRYGQEVADLVWVLDSPDGMPIARRRALVNELVEIARTRLEQDLDDE